MRLWRSDLVGLVCKHAFACCLCLRQAHWHSIVVQELLWNVSARRRPLWFYKTAENTCFHTGTERHTETLLKKKHPDSFRQFYGAVSVLLAGIISEVHALGGCAFGTKHVLFLVLFIYWDCFLTSMCFWLCDLERGQRRGRVDRVGRARQWRQGRISERQMQEFNIWSVHMASNSLCVSVYLALNFPMSCLNIQMLCYCNTSLACRAAYSSPIWFHSLTKQVWLFEAMTKPNMYTLL